MVPFDKRSPFVTSGIRIGTPALTTKGMKEDEMKIIAGFIDQVLRNIDNEAVYNDIRQSIRDLNKDFQLYT
jgi:glycine hydroxymethyltransferase